MSKIKEVQESTMKMRGQEAASLLVGKKVSEVRYTTPGNEKAR